MQSRNSLFDELSRHSGPMVETRAENAFAVASKFINLLREQAPDDKSFDLMMKAWMRAIKDNDFSKFRRVYKKYAE